MVVQTVEAVVLLVARVTARRLVVGTLTRIR
jgi:hypothetical protein